MKFIREHIIFRFLWFIIALHILNCSIDTPDGIPSSQPEDLTINDIETVYELVVEKLLGYENAVPEHDEPGDEENNRINAKKTVDFYYSQFSLNLPPIHKQSAERYCLFKDTYYKQFHPELTPPPPKA
jgi:hypothetical protein